MTTEQLTKKTEQTSQSSETKEAETASTPEVQPSAKQADTTKQDNKAYRSLQSALDKVNAKLALLEKGKQSKSKEDEIKAEVDSLVGEDGEPIPDEKKRVIKAYALEYVTKTHDLNQRAEELDARENRVILVEETFALNDELIKDAMVQMDDADSPKAKRLQAKQLKDELQEKAVLALVENNASLREKLIEVLTGTKEETEVKRPDSGRTSTSGGKKGKTPTLVELRASTPADTEKKVKSGEWVLPGWVS